MNRERTRQRYAEEPEFREYKRGYANKTQKTYSKESAVKNVTKWQEKNPEKHKCHRLFYNALRNKEITRPQECSFCGSEKNIQGHHVDYAKPLEVIWCCKSCHHKLHDALRYSNTGV